MMVVNKQMRVGGRCKAGDIVEVLLQRDRDQRVVELPPEIKNVIASNKIAQAT